MNARSAEIMALFPIHGPMTPPMLADVIGCSDSHASTLLRELYDEGLLTRSPFFSGRRGRPAWRYEPK
jgi:predicted ArsR family transcriptional regulator